MGAHHARTAPTHDIDEEVTFDHFQILRAIGRGSFGKVCIAEKRGTRNLYAMKYMNKAQCRQRDALGNVLREVEILSKLEHPFLVNLWFSFQDEEDFFMVSDLFTGGDLRYHIQQRVRFEEDCAWLYVFELALALDYLQTKCIIHRDLKPDNVLLDEQGHVHLTDFNIATVIKDGQLATSMSGTKPYMAPEIFACAAEACAGYNWSVDWWSLGVCIYEMLALFRPYDIHSTTSLGEVRALFDQPLAYPKDWSRHTVQLLAKLLAVEPGRRITSVRELHTLTAMAKFHVQDVLDKKITPFFIPPSDHLNCDPSLELEEMIIESKPLHKKKKRLAKQRSLQPAMSIDIDYVPDQNERKFPIYNREQELRRREREQKELIWEEELLRSMQLSEVSTTSSTTQLKTQPPSPVENNLKRSTSYSGYKNSLPDVKENEESAKKPLATRTSR